MIADVSSHSTITESGGGLKRPGETLQLTCAVSGFSLTGADMDWVRQAPGKGVEWTARIWYNGPQAYNSGLKNRLTISRDTSKGQVFLQVHDLKPEDSGMYYCSRGTLRKCFTEDFILVCSLCEGAHNLSRQLVPLSYCLNSEKFLLLSILKLDSCSLTVPCPTLRDE
uniref:Ig-like domain-containing protein n=1 Tax=Varanus komodoensis TaxID=61221 RepID=A0A8D2LGS8_VARKO